MPIWEALTDSIRSKSALDRAMAAIKSAARRKVGIQISFALYGAANRMASLQKPLLEPLGLPLNVHAANFIIAFNPMGVQDAT